MVKKLLVILLAIGTLFFITNFFSQPVQAGELTNTMLKLDRLTASTPTGGTVCAKTPSSSNGTVAQVTVVFPTGFLVNTNTSHWTVTTSSLPSGSTAWPGIDTATAVSGQRVTFPSADLTTDTYYCFNFSGINTLTTGSTTGDDQNGTMITQTSGGTDIDSKSYAESIVPNDQVSITATVPAKPTDFDAIISSDTSSTVSQNTIITYTITYGSHLAYQSDITVEAEWTKGTILGSGVATVEGLDYVVGSASNGYNSTLPVIDPANHKIDWTIPSFPGNTTGQTVKFQLRTKDYTLLDTLTFTIAGRLLGPGTQTPDSTVMNTYRYNFAIPQQSSGSSSNSSPSTPSTPLPAVPQLTFTNLTLTQLSDSEIKFRIGTTENSNLTVHYGLSPTNLNQSITLHDFSTLHTIDLTQLKANTKYYVKLFANNPSTGQTAASDTFIFTTAATSTPPSVINKSLVVSSENNIVYVASQDNTGAGNVVILPEHTPFEFHFQMNNPSPLKSVNVTIQKHQQILGISNFFFQPVYADELSSQTTEVTQIANGTYVGRLNTPATGLYDMIINTQDSKGNINSSPIALLKVIKPLTVFDKKSQQPIEGARVILYWFNIQTNSYELLSQNTVPITNPSYTDINGEVHFVLFQGKYKAEVSNLGNQKVTKEFMIGPLVGEEFPMIYMQKASPNILTYIQYIATACNDFIINTGTNYFGSVIQSTRFYTLVASFSLLFLILLALLAFSARTHIPIFKIPSFLLYHIHSFKPNQNKYLNGIIIDKETNKPISRAEITILDKSKKVLEEVLSDKSGHFFYKNPLKEHVLEVQKVGYEQEVCPRIEAENSQTIVLLRNETVQQRIQSNLWFSMETIFGSLFEVILVFSLILEILFQNHFGILKTAPFIAILVINFILWIFYLKHKEGQ